MSLFFITSSTSSNAKLCFLKTILISQHGKYAKHKLLGNHISNTLCNYKYLMVHQACLNGKKILCMSQLIKKTKLFQYTLLEMTIDKDLNTIYKHTYVRYYLCWKFKLKIFRWRQVIDIFKKTICLSFFVKE